MGSWEISPHSGADGRTLADEFRRGRALLAVTPSWKGRHTFSSFTLPGLPAVASSQISLICVCDPLSSYSCWLSSLIAFQNSQFALFSVFRFLKIKSWQWDTRNGYVFPDRCPLLLGLCFSIVLLFNALSFTNTEVTFLMYLIIIIIFFFTGDSPSDAGEERPELGVFDINFACVCRY